MSYSLGWSKDSSPAGEDLNCLCAFCREWLLKGQYIRSNEVHKCGELHYIELAHEHCVDMDMELNAEFNSEEREDIS